MNFSIYIKTDSIKSYEIKAIEEFAKRLQRYCKIKYYFIKDEAALGKLLPKNTYCISIQKDNTTISSEDFANRLNSYGIRSVSNLSFFINCMPPLPVSENLTLSQMDFSPSIQMLILYEQIYRSFRILRGEPYHK